MKSISLLFLVVAFAFSTCFAQAKADATPVVINSVDDFHRAVKRIEVKLDLAEQAQKTSQAQERALIEAATAHQQVPFKDLEDLAAAQGAYTNRFSEIGADFSVVLQWLHENPKKQYLDEFDPCVKRLSKLNKYQTLKIDFGPST